MKRKCRASKKERQLLSDLKDVLKIIRKLAKKAYLG